MRGGYPGSLDKTVWGTFTGVFHWKSDGHPAGTLDVQLIRDISVTPAR
jgi:hypothetical protein